MSMRMADYSTSMSDASPRSDEGDDSFSVIDRHSVFDGTFLSDRDVRIEGEVRGTIECKGTLFVAQGATVSARVEAEHIAVAGDLNGDIVCRGRLQIMPSGRVKGHVATVTLVINEGAFYEGQLEMTAAPAAPAQAPSQRPVASPRPLQTVAPPPPAEEIAVDREPDASPPPTSNRPTPLNDPAANTFIRRLGGPETPWEDRGDRSGPTDDDEPTS